MKEYKESTLMSFTKRRLVEEIECLYHNLKVEKDRNKIVYRRLVKATDKLKENHSTEEVNNIIILKEELGRCKCG